MVKVVVVEDDELWVHELVLMYSRILSKNPKATDYHKDVVICRTANHAIQYFKAKPGERSNASPKVDVLSLDLNLGRTGGATGLDVLKSAVNAGQNFATIVVSGFANDNDLHQQLGSKTSYLVDLENRIANLTKAKCLVHPKLSTDIFGSITQQANALMKKLENQVHGNSNVLRVWTEDLRGTAADLNGKILCLHFELPRDLFESPNDLRGRQRESWVMGALINTTLDSLNKISAWHTTFGKIDHTSTDSDLLTRLLFLITAGKNYQTGLSLRPIDDLVDFKTGKISAPLPKEQWICPRKGNGINSLTPRESFQLTQLVFQEKLISSGNSECKLPNAVYKDGELDFENVAAPPSKQFFDLEVSGLCNGRTLTTPAGKSLSNGASLDVERYVKNQSGKLVESKAAKATRCILNRKLKNILRVNYDLITAVETPSKTYKLQIPGCIYIQREA